MHPTFAEFDIENVTKYGEKHSSKAFAMFTLFLVSKKNVLGVKITVHKLSTSRDGPVKSTQKSQRRNTRLNTTARSCTETRQEQTQKEYPDIEKLL